MKDYQESVNGLCAILVSMVTGILLLGCSSDEMPTPGFAEPPTTYFLTEEVVVVEDPTNTFADQNFFTYNSNGKLAGDGIFYNGADQLIQSPWPNRTVLTGLYYYTQGRADSIVTYGHPRYTLFFDMEYSGDQISEIRIYRKENDESTLTLIEDMIITYPAMNEIKVESENTILNFYLDEGRSPYPYEYRLSHWWWPYSQNISLILTDRNVQKLIVTTDGDVTSEIAFTYDYNEFGFPTRSTLGNRSKFFKYAETPN